MTRPLKGRVLFFNLNQKKILVNLLCNIFKQKCIKQRY